MKYSNIEADLVVSKLGIGGNIFGYLCDYSQTAQILDYAADNGINFVDTADVYSNGESESLIGKALREKRQKWIIASKVGLRSSEVPYGLGNKKDIIKKIDGTLKRLNTDYIDLYQIHHFDPKTPIYETLEALNCLVDKGKIRYFGCSNYNLSQLQESINVVHENNFRKFRTVQLHYNPFKRKNESMFEFCMSEQIGVIVYGVLGRGALTDKYITPQDTNCLYRASISDNIKKDLTEFFLNAIESLRDYANRYKGISVQSLLISWVLREPVSSVIIGVRNIQQLQSNLNALDVQMSPRDLLHIDNIIGDLENYKSISLGEFI